MEPVAQTLGQMLRNFYGIIGREQVNDAKVIDIRAGTVVRKSRAEAAFVGIKYDVAALGWLIWQFCRALRRKRLRV